MAKEKKYKSNCPQYLALEVFGDKWTLLIIRDMMINGKKYFREFLQSKEKIASNILTNRLQMLEEEGIIRRKQDPNHKQKIIYLLTERGIDLFPILMENARWSLKYKPVEDIDRAKAQAILDGGQKAIEQIMEQLRHEHLD
ncbi:winged helix-turn-helix transcriptional regulator [Flagellimonas meridianipacifica]|uniref:DNA-binding HxlR family transcriptional regulator n=1 Tax=Flagellimonas meridianipacifica TaxID=1080225 RepID=A0A2T0MIJ7_9FLAO|nr:helix-turn-helix domain-containing protein [Allomuricauda pacifica]PRX57414.1 DNA-binding HxlR family transcriptional regulator [Allomuricauda pacifica]